MSRFGTVSLLAPPIECKPENHKELDEDWRYHSRISSGRILVDDNNLPEGWYRFSKSSNRMIERDELYQGKVSHKVCQSKHIHCPKNA